MGGIPQETLLAFNHIPKKHSGSGSAGNWQRHNKFLFYKLVLIFAETMQVSWRYHSSIKVLTSCFSIATFSSGIITKSDFSTLGNSVAEEFLPASSLCVLEFLSGPLFSPFWTTTCHLQSSSFHCSPLFPRSLMTCWRHSSHYRTLWKSNICLSLLIAREQLLILFSWLLNNPCKHGTFSSYGPVYSKTLNNILQRFFGN